MTFTEEQIEKDLAACGIPFKMYGGIKRYLILHIMPGRFLQAVFENSFVDACAQADDENQLILRSYASWLYNYLPGRGDNAPWGSADAVQGWVDQRAEG